MTTKSNSKDEKDGSGGTKHPVSNSLITNPEKENSGTEYKNLSQEMKSINVHDNNSNVKPVLSTVLSTVETSHEKETQPAPDTNDHVPTHKDLNTTRNINTSNSKYISMKHKSESEVIIHDKITDKAAVYSLREKSDVTNKEKLHINSVNIALHENKKVDGTSLDKEKGNAEIVPTDYDTLKKYTINNGSINNGSINNGSINKKSNGKKTNGVDKEYVLHHYSNNKIDNEPLPDKAIVDYASNFITGASNGEKEKVESKTNSEKITTAYEKEFGCNTFSKQKERRHSFKFENSYTHYLDNTQNDRNTPTSVQNENTQRKYITCTK
jgi:hypothetical protein